MVVEHEMNMRGHDEQSREPGSLTGTNDSYADPTFHSFLALPAELRREIWLQYLNEAEVTPRVYRLSVRYPEESLRSDHPDASDILRRNYYPQNSDRVTLVLCALLPDEDNHGQQFMDSTFASRTASSICRESRQILVELLPDTLEFKSLRRWNGVEPEGASQSPQFTFRFNGQKDIFIFEAGWEDQQAVERIVKLQGQSPRSFLPMQNVGISYGAFEFGHMGGGRDTEWGVDDRDCMCDTEACADCCRLEPLPPFLACFPNLKTFYIARIAADDPEDFGLYMDYAWVKDATCKCVTDDGQAKHVWPTVRATDSNCEWCVIFDERSGCPFPPLAFIERARQNWRSHFPYYKALEHLDIKFLRRLDPNGKPGYRYRGFG